jgi:hypothetical protein
LNGIFGNTDLIFYYLEAIDEILQNHKLTNILNPSSASSSSPTSAASSPTTPSPLLHTILNSAPKSPPTHQRTAQQVDKLTLSSEEEQKPEDTLTYLLEQVMASAKTIQKCADHQKCMTDDVLQLSRLRSNKLTITNTFFNPYETVLTAMTIF